MYLSNRQWGKMPLRPGGLLYLQNVWYLLKPHFDTINQTKPETKPKNKTKLKQIICSRGSVCGK